MTRTDWTEKELEKLEWMEREGVKREVAEAYVLKLRQQAEAKAIEENKKAGTYSKTYGVDDCSVWDAAESEAREVAIQELTETNVDVTSDLPEEVVEATESEDGKVAIKTGYEYATVEWDEARDLMAIELSIADCGYANGISEGYYQHLRGSNAKHC